MSADDASAGASPADADTLASLVVAAATSHGDRVAIVDGATRLTYAELLDEARTFAAALLDAGVRPGDRVAIWCPNCVEWVVAVLGIWQIGAVLVPVNTRFKGNEAADILARSGATVLVTVTDFLDTDYVAMLDATGVELPELSNTVIARGSVPEGAEGWADFLGRATDDARAEVARLADAVSPDDVSDILFTSGTTGAPKGVVQTHGRTLLVATDWVQMSGLIAGDVYLMVNPYFHMFGLKAGILPSVAAGATMLPEPVFDVERVLSRVADEQVTVLPGAPTIYQSLLDHPTRDAHDLSSLRVAVTGAADIPVELIRRIREELPFEVVVTGYGLTEAGTGASTSPDDPPDVVATTVGRARPSFELRIVDGDTDVTEGEPGEILLRGGSVMSHYLDDPEATAAALSDDGWLRTGDLGVIDDNGCLRIIGRSKDMIIVGGFNAYPAEIENALLRHPAIRQVAVIGIPDDRLGEVPMAFVVPGADTASTESEIVEWGRAEMANYKAPRRVDFVDELPMNAAGKVLKEELRARAAAGSGGDAPS